MPFDTKYFKTRQQALAYFNKVARGHIAFMIRDNESDEYLVATEEYYRFIKRVIPQQEWDLDMSLELCSE